MAESIMQYQKVCWVCGIDKNLHCHHIFYGTDNRQKSDEDGCVVWLCAAHHNMSSQGVHFNKALDLKLKRYCQTVWMLKYTDADDTKEEKINKFISRFGNNYLPDEPENKYTY